MYSFRNNKELSKNQTLQHIKILLLRKKDVRDMIQLCNAVISKILNENGLLCFKKSTLCT